MTRAKEFLYMTASELYDGLKRKQKLSPFVMEAFCLDDQPLPIPGIVGEGIAPVKPVQAPKHSTLVPPTKFSASALESFEKCPLQFKYDHVLKVRIPAEANTNFGSSVHKALELWYRARREGGTPNLESLLRKAWIPGGYESKALEEKAFASAVTQLAIYLASPAGQIVPYELEQPIQYKLENGIYITGKIDRIDPTDSEGVTIVDYKTGKIPTKEAKENLPLNFYALALSQKGLSVKNVSLHYVMAGKEVTLAKEELKLDLVLRQIVELTDEIKQAYVDGDFPARPDIRTCKYCSFNKICPFRFEKGR
jgi:DNA helicase-2/ATP-dependent DNA helicase PcrA